jgi:hypothetical protein
VFIIFAMMVFLTTVSLLMMGLMCELLIRIYHESQDRPPYRIRRVWRTLESPAPDGAGVHASYAPVPAGSIERGGPALADPYSSRASSEEAI